MKLSDPFDVVLVASSSDPAIDEKAMLEPVAFGDAERKRTRLEAYIVTRDPAHLVYLPGAKPLAFQVRPLRAREANEIVGDLGRPDPNELWSIVQKCLIAVRGPGSEAFGADDFATVDPMRGTKRVTDDGMEKLANLAGIAGVREIGESILRRAAISESTAAPFASPRG